MSSSGVSALLFFVGLILSIITGIVQSSRVDDELLLRNFLLRQYLEPGYDADDRRIYSIPKQALLKYSSIDSDSGRRTSEPRGAAMNFFWRGRRTPLAFSDSYTPTPCRWKLCASYQPSYQLFRDSF
ncbi:hypothetical protein Ddc_05846 [Ditylenchus destructor]|nr:hypothetical protein Ddc_05846 [Ditylenchus destructor]